MLNMRTKTALGVMCVIIGIGILATPVIGAGNYRAVEAVATVSDIRHSVIIDAGHGGADGGAVSLSGVYESDINLAISLRLEQLMAFLGVRPVMTRATSEIDYPKDAETIRQKKVSDQNARLELINDVYHGVLISIHQNKYTSDSPSGAQILYAATDGSEELANQIQGSLSHVIGANNVRDSKQISSDIYIMKNIRCPGVLVECGFLSNPVDEALLLTDGYQLKLASGIAGGYVQAFERSDMA